MEKWLRPIFCQVISILVSEIYPPELALKTCSYLFIGFKNLFIYLQCRWGPTATLTLLKVTWNEDPDQEF